MKHWGRVKIKYELKQRRVSEYGIKEAMKQIDEDEYMKVLAKLATEKLNELKSEGNDFVRKKKAFDFLLQKGFERDLIICVIKE